MYEFEEPNRRPNQGVDETLVREYRTYLAVVSKKRRSDEDRVPSWWDK